MSNIEAGLKKLVGAYQKLTSIHDNYSENLPAEQLKMLGEALDELKSLIGELEQRYNLQAFKLYECA